MTRPYRALRRDSLCHFHLHSLLQNRASPRLVRKRVPPLKNGVLQCSHKLNVVPVAIIRAAYPSRVRRHVRENMRAIYVQCRDLPGTAPAVPGQIPADEAEGPAVAGILQITPPRASQRAVIGKLPRGDEACAIFANR